jgi:hypothetical protein
MRRPCNAVGRCFRRYDDHTLYPNHAIAGTQSTWTSVRQVFDEGRRSQEAQHARFGADHAPVRAALILATKMRLLLGPRVPGRACVTGKSVVVVSPVT